MKQPTDAGWPAWYAAEGNRGQQLLAQGDVSGATEVFEAILARLGETPSYARAVMLGRLGRCFLLSDRPGLAVPHLRDAIAVIGRLAPSDGVKGLRGTLRSDLGSALRASGQYDAARRAYEAALKIARELKDLRAEGVELGRLGALALTEGDLEAARSHQQAALRLFQQLDEHEMEAAAWHQLGRVCHQQQQWDEADRHYREAARINEQRGQLAAAAHTWNQLAAVARQAGRPESGEEWLRKALDVERRIGNPVPLGHSLIELATLLQNQPGRLGEARQLAREALAIAQQHDPLAEEVWRNYGVLAAIIEQEARVSAEGAAKTGLEMQARDYRELQRQGPVIGAALARAGDPPSRGRAVILGQLGRCFHTGSRPDLAAAFAREAIRITALLAPTDGVSSLRGALQADLADMLRAGGHHEAAGQADEAALRIAEALQDLRAQAHLSRRLGRTFQERRPRNEALPFEVTIDEELATDYVFEPDLLIDGPRERRMTACPAEAIPAASDLRPTLPPGTRVWMDGEGAIRVRRSHEEPALERHPDCTIVRRVRRDVVVAGNPEILWQLISLMDGVTTAAGILSRFPDDQAAVAARMLGALAASGAIDVSGRPVGRFLHSATKKGVLPGGGLEGDAVLRLATDGNHRSYPEAPRVSVGQTIPDRLGALHHLTRMRRSRRDYDGRAVGRGDFEALLHSACGVTGTMSWAGREVKLRAYPSSGALYAVEIYPMVFRVEGLDPGVYHYRAAESALEVVRSDLDRAVAVGAALPVEREMMAGAAALFCLTGCFLRHESKYGEGGYRMLVAEAGHISQNLILAATALGLSARPFGGVFDDLVNHDLGLDGSEEQFLLAVLVGHTPTNESGH